MNILEYLTVAKVIARPKEDILKGFDNRLIVDTGDKDKDYCLEPLDEPEKFLCWLTKRLLEWEDIKGFAVFYGLPYNSIKGECLDVAIPLDWLTSPLTLPEKVGEYIKWRDEK